jgi:hypothetical protein
MSREVKLGFCLPKGQCHDIFDLHLFHRKVTWAPDYPTEILSNLVSNLQGHLNLKFEGLTKLMFPTWKSRASGPAQGTSRSIRKKSCELYILYIYPFVHIMSHTHDVYLYKSAKTSSCEGRVVLYMWNMNRLGQTTCYWVGQNKYNWMRACARWGELNWGQGQDGLIHEVLQKTAAQVYIDVYNEFIITLSLLKSWRM